MSTMSSSLAGFAQLDSKRDSAKPGLLLRIFTSLQDARMRAAERDVARFVEMSGGRMTDDVERQIERRFI